MPDTSAKPMKESSTDKAERRVPPRPPKRPEGISEASAKASKDASNEAVKGKDVKKAAIRTDVAEENVVKSPKPKRTEKVKPNVITNPAAEDDKETASTESVEPEKEKTSRSGSQSSQTVEATDEAQVEGSRWRRLVNKSSMALQSSKESAAAAAAARKEAAALKLKATQESIRSSKEAASAAATAKKEAAASRLKETGDSIKSTTTSASEKIKGSSAAASNAVKESSSNAAASVNAGFWNVVQMAQKAAEETKKKIPGRAADTITIIHYNDVCNIEAREAEPIGGASRFLTAVKDHQECNPLILFSGNTFSPSMMSTFTRGEQMVPILNRLGTHCAVLGNHDFDFGLDVLYEHMEKSEFPWLISNVIDNETGRPLADAKVHHTIDWSGRKIGLIGLVEREWLDSLANINQEEVDYTDYVDAASMLTAELKKKGCEIVIALTHMRTHSDIRLAENVAEVDLILGGHSKVYEKRRVNGTTILKSGSDFRQFSKITINFREDPIDIETEAVDVTKDIDANEDLDKFLEEFTDIEETKIVEVLGTLNADLDGRFSSTRTAESNLGNLMTDIMMGALNADCALINAGTLRSNTKHPKGEFRLKELLNILPMMDPLVVLDVDGRQIHQSLENGVSQWPKLDGRFPQVSGITFAFDPSKKPGSRVDPSYIKIGEDYIDLERHYKLVTKSYLANGQDGYSDLAQGTVLVDEDCAPTLTGAVLNHFRAIEIKKGKQSRSVSHHQSIVPRSKRQDPNKSRLEDEACKLEAKLEGRILQMTAKVAEKLKQEKEEHLSGSHRSDPNLMKNGQSPQDETRQALFDIPAKKTNGVKSKPEVAEEMDLK